MNKHAFYFEGGELLTRIGASWFVSYMYYERIDPSHMNWSLVKTRQMRINTYRKGESYYKIWLQHVLTMNDSALNTNTIKLEATEIKDMARKILNLSFINTCGYNFEDRNTFAHTGRGYHFEGGELLTQIGASWFVSYMYHEKIDSSHMNWSLVKTRRMRIETCRKGELYHTIWLQHVLTMNDSALNTNTIKLEATEIKDMARRILESY